MATAAASILGRRIRDARTRRRWSQRELGKKVDLDPSRIGQLERGEGAGATLETWYALGVALDIPFKAEFWRDQLEEPLDAGHLRIQELMLRLARETGRPRGFELPTRPSNPAYSVDVGVRDDTNRVLIIEECWNTLGNVNASIRSTHTKVAQAMELAVAVGGEDGPYRVAACWIVRDTRRNREIVDRYPEVFATAFPASSRAWVRALTAMGVAPPMETGLVWCDLDATRLFAARHQR